MSDIKSIADLTPDPKNARRHTVRNVGMLEQALNEVGAARSIVIDDDGVVLAGNATIEAAAQAGITRVQVVEADGNTLVAVRRRGLTAEQKTKLALYDNRVAELAEWEPDVLSSLAQEFDLSGMFFDEELADILASVEETQEGAGGDEFDTTPEDGPTRTQVGELWVIGGVHRLLVGDCTDPANVARLMGGERADMAWFDPPFGIDLQPQRGNTDAIANDGNAEAREVWRVFLPSLYANLKDNTVAFLCQDWTEFDWTLPLVREQFTIKSKVVWYKTQWGIGYYLRPQHEDILYCWKGTPPMPDSAISDVWEMARLNAPEHAAEKPIGLMQQAVEFACVGGGLVIDWFAGVGGTLIAAHRSGRRAFLCELSPNHSDVILRRAEAEGLSVERVDG